jgi:hypothetical protein
MTDHTMVEGPNSVSKAAVDTLLCEYREIREEMRMTQAAMDKNIATAFTVLGGIVSIALAVAKVEVIYTIPSLFFMFAMNHITKSMGLGMLGTYCYSIENKLHAMFRSGDIGMSWEGGPVGIEARRPSSLRVIGIYVTFLPITLGCFYISALCYHLWAFSALIHISEFAALLVYGVASLRWYSIGNRRNRAPNSEILTPRHRD